MHFILSSTETSHMADSPIQATQRMVKKFYRKLDRMLTAIAYAEAGDLDAVKEILEQDRLKAQEKQ